MSWTVEYSDDLQIVILTYEGRVSGEDIKKAAAARIDMGRQKGVTKFLVDTKKVEADETAIIEIYDIPDKLYPEKHAQITDQIAMIRPYSSTSRKMVKFFEDTCVNRGCYMMTFQNRESAINWLQQSTSQSPSSDRLSEPPEE